MKTNKKNRSAKATPPAKAVRRAALLTDSGSVTLEQAKAIVQDRAPKRALTRQLVATVPLATPGSVGAERKKLRLQHRKENQQRIREYKATMQIMKQRGVTGLAHQAAKAGSQRGPIGPVGSRAPAALAPQPLQIFAEGDSWFDYPIPFFGGGIIPRLEDQLGVPILNLAKAGDEVRFMLGVEERKVLAKHLMDGCPVGGAWDVLLFSGGGNDIVDNPMALWIKDFNPGVPPSALIHQARYDAALALVRAGYEDLITLRDTFSPGTHLVFHAYDFAIPDGRGVCFLGPWLKPTFDLRKFPVSSPARFEVVKAMLQQFAALLLSLESRGNVTFINGQGTLAPVPSSWHNELHPSKQGFDKFANLFHAKLKALFPARVL